MSRIYSSSGTRRFRHLANVVIPSLLLYVAFLAYPANAEPAQLKTWDTVVVLEQDSALWEIVVEYEETAVRDDIWVLGDIRSYETFVDEKRVECDLRRDVGSSLLCNIQGKKYRYLFTTSAQTAHIGAYVNFRYNFVATKLSDRFTVTVKLPLGAALVEAEKLMGTGLRPFEPGFGQQGTDGRRIYVKWDIVTPKLGETISTNVVFENIAPPPNNDFTAIIVIIVVIVAGAMFLLLKKRSAAPVRSSAWKLNKEERTVLQIIASNGKLEQSRLVQDTGLNKVKVSRIISRLEDLDFIKSVRLGRKNILCTTQRAVEADWLVHLNEIKESVVRPWLNDLNVWHGEGEKPPLSLGISSRIKKQLLNDMENHFPSISNEWRRLWKEYIMYARSWGRVRQALQAILLRHGKIMNPAQISKMLAEIGEGKPPVGISLSRDIKDSAKSLAIREKKLIVRISKFRDQLEKLEHYNKLPGSCEYIGH